MPPQRASRHPESLRTEPYPIRSLLGGVAAPAAEVRETQTKSGITPAEFFAQIHERYQRAVRVGRHGPLVVRGKPSTGCLFMDVERIGRPKYRLTKEFLTCFFDLIATEVRDIMRVHDRTLRRARTWCGVTRWPRVVVLTNTHPVLNVPEIQRLRLSYMDWALANDHYAYEMLYEAHKKAGCSLEGIPPPPPVQEVPVPAPPPPPLALSRKVKLPDRVARDRAEALRNFAASLPSAEETANCFAHLHPAQKGIGFADRLPSSEEYSAPPLSQPAEYFQAPFSGVGPVQTKEPAPERQPQLPRVDLPEFDQELADAIAQWDSDDDGVGVAAWDSAGRATPDLSELMCAGGYADL